MVIWVYFLKISEAENKSEKIAYISVEHDLSLVFVYYIWEQLI